MSVLANKHILFLTSTNLACNPRCLKEVRLAVSQGAKVTVVAFILHNWSDRIEAALNRELTGVDFHYLETTKKKWFTWLIASLAERTARFISPLVNESVFWAAIAVSKRSWLLLNWVKRSSIQPALVIAHNPAAFYPASYLASLHTIPFALDIEDYHPGESIPENAKNGVSLLMSKLIPATAYTSFAAPLIKQYTEKLLHTSTANTIVINNYFASKDFSAPFVSQKEKLQLVWFSQNIDAGRGLEALLLVFPAFENVFDLTLIGNPKEPFCTNFIAGNKGITVIPSLHPSKLIQIMAQFDIGLAMEPAKDLNNTLALSNKLLTYFQAGLFIIASETPAQKLFMDGHPQHGVCTALSKEKLYAAFTAIAENQDEIKRAKQDRFTTARSFNWENESAILLKEWNRLLADKAVPRV